ncbi:B-cell antigen receptor complex-associated protein beta chain [Siphateles boraxobius]|uniref:B-cell antigen receptor complex-associated protein beta chain n=1 Tax=Siphateles boraxobius TaxID=180520 RepID=UPI004062DA40
MTRTLQLASYSSVYLICTDFYIFLERCISRPRIMHSFLLGCSVMALVYLSAEANNINVFQKPRFLGVKTGRSVMIYCVSSSSLPAHVVWFKDRTEKDTLKNSHRIVIKEKSEQKNAYIVIKQVEMEDSGIYFCKLNDTLGPGTALQVSRYSEPQAILHRSRVKDVIIFLQAFLLILCIVIPLVQFYKLEKKEEADYEEPEDDHIYEGLEIEQCGGDVYEDISVYAQPTDAAWEVESPDQE